jgi:hypothetical protein
VLTPPTYLLLDQIVVRSEIMDVLKQDRTGPALTSMATLSDSETPSEHSSPILTFLGKFCEVVNWTPPNCRWDPERPPQFSMGLNVLFAFACAFTVANLYYNHPILNILAHEFNVPYEKSAQIPTLMQAGYAVGLFFLCPLGDLLRRRPFVLSLVFFTSSLW